VSQSLTYSIGVELLLVNIHYFLWILLFFFFALTSDGTAGCRISGLLYYLFLELTFSNLYPNQKNFV
jgi:hypothetical protein